MLKSSISLPGLAVRWLFTELDAQAKNHPVTLLDEKNKDLYELVRQNLVGGPSIIFHRHHEKGNSSFNKSVQDYVSQC